MVFQIQAQQLAPTDNMALLKGIVTNFKGQPLMNEIIIFHNARTQQSLQAHTNAAGRFEMLVPVNATYDLRYKNFTLDMQYTKMQVPADPEATYEVQIRIDPPKEFVLKNVYFETGKSILQPSSYKALNDLVEVLKLKSAMVIEIQGHTDNVGSNPDNLKLSQDRAEAVKKYLLSKGIAAGRVGAKGFGHTRPVAENDTEEGRARNRRTSLKVISQ